MNKFKKQILDVVKDKALSEGKEILEGRRHGLYFHDSRMYYCDVLDGYKGYIDFKEIKEIRVQLYGMCKDSGLFDVFIAMTDGTHTAFLKNPIAFKPEPKKKAIAKSKPKAPEISKKSQGDPAVKEVLDVIEGRKEPAGGRAITPHIDKALRKIADKYETDKKVQEEFSSESTYYHYLRAAYEGKVRMADETEEARGKVATRG